MATTPLVIPKRPSECAALERCESDGRVWRIYYTVHERAMSWFVLQVQAFECEKDLFGTPDDEFTADPDIGEWFAHGSIKRDGCADFDIGDDRAGSYRHHSCAGGLDLPGKMLCSIDTLAKRVWADYGEP